MDDGSPALEVDFIINPAASLGALDMIDAAISTTEAKVVAEAAKIEKATSGMVKLAGVGAAIGSIGPAFTREAATAAREAKRIEQAGEGIIRHRERELAIYGKSRGEIRAVRAEEAALAAERVGNSDLATRIRAAELALYEQEFAAARRARIEAEAVAEAKQIASQKATAAAEAEARAVREAAHAYQMFQAYGKEKMAAYRDGEAANLRAEAAAARVLATEQASLASAVRASHDAQVSDAAAAERLRASTDPLYAATSRLNAEIAESTRLYHAGVTGAGEYARQQQVLAGRMNEAQRELGGVGASGKLAGHHMQNLAFQFQDLTVQMAAAAGSSAPLKMAFMALLQQGSQIQGIMSQADIGIRGVAAAFGQMSKAVLVATVTNPVLLGLTVAVTTFAGAVALLNKSANDGADMKKYAQSLGLTVKEMRQLDNLTVTWGDTAKAVFQVAAAGAVDAAKWIGELASGALKWAGDAIAPSIGSAITDVWNRMEEWLAWLGTASKTAVNGMIGAYVGGFLAIKATWSALPAAYGDIFYSAVNVSIEAINSMIRKAVNGINSFIGSANTVLNKVGLDLPELKAGQIDKVDNQYAGAAAKVGKTFRDEIGKAMGTDYLGAAGSAISGAATKVGNAIREQARKNARDRIREQAEQKGYLDPGKARTDKHAEQLARDAEAIEAQIRNLYALADAYGVSGAAALIAEARVKAESKAIRQQADIEAAVSQQVQLAIAQRVSDAAKATASTRDQARVQAEVNASVAAGLVPAERAAELVRDRIADLPLLAAIEAAQQRGLATEAARATKVLGEQRDARVRLNAETIAAQFNSDMAGGRDQLAVLAEELRLVGATDAARVHALATLKATQEAQAKNFDPAQARAYIDGQVKIADATERNRRAQDGYNASLTFAGDMLDLIDRNAQSAAQGISDAFGEAGRAIGDALTSVTGYFAEQERMRAAHEAAVKAAGADQVALDRENAMFAARSANQQVRLYGTLASSAKGFFKEGSAGYKAMGAAEKVFRAIELANAIRSAALQLGLIGGTVAAKVAGDAAMAASDTARAGVEQGNSLASAAVKGVEAVVNAIRSLPFPANLAAGAATAAAITALGVSIAGGFGGKNDLPKANTGTGTVLGDSDARSESIQRSLDVLRDIDDATLTVSRGMLSSLRSIEQSIGGLSTLLVRAGNINASADVSEGFKPNAIGSLLSNIPVLGGILGGLFGTKTKVIASGLYGGPQSLDQILGSGFDASYYSDVQKKKKLFGLTTSTKYRTELTGADTGIEDQFTLLIRQFYEAVGQAAGPLGVSLDAVKRRLAGFTVDIGKIDLQGLTGDEIQEKLSAVFGAAADRMAEAALPGLARFQKVGEGAFETLVRVSSTVEQVDAAMQRLGATTSTLGVDAGMGLAGMFDSVGDFTSAAGAYLDAYYSDAERAAAETARMGKAFAALGLTMPDTLAGFRGLVEAQDLTSAAGQEMYATLLKLAPAFADLKGSLDGAASAAAIVREREDLQRKLLELSGDEAAIRAADLAKVDASNRALQQQVWAVQDAQEAAKAAEQLRDAWKSVGSSIMDEVRRIRGLNDAGGGATFASLMGQFNTATAAAVAGDMDAAKALPQLSKSLLDAASQAATSRQELDRVQSQTASVLEAVAAAIGTTATADPVETAATATAAQATATANNTASMIEELRALRSEVAGLRAENNNGHAATAGNTGRIDRRLEDVTAASGGQAITIAQEAA